MIKMLLGSTSISVGLLMVFSSLSAGAQQPSNYSKSSPRLNAEISKDRTQAKRIFERLTGTKTPLDNPELDEVEARIASGNKAAAIDLILKHPNFYNITVKKMALEMSNRSETIGEPLNDFTATFVGTVRDNLDARLLLTGNFYYIAKPDTASVPRDLATDILASNNHFAAIERERYSLPEVLVHVPGQKLLTEAGPVDHPDPAGVITSRAFMAAHAEAGTNRRPLEFLFREFMCTPIEMWADVKASDIRIGRDIDRAPGGEPHKFLTNCKGCHTVMDGFRGAFAYFDFEGGFTKHAKTHPSTGGNATYRFSADQGVASKMNENGDVFPGGYITRDDSFINNANRGTNKDLFGWRGPAKGKGLGELAALVANSKRFSHCMAKRTYKAFCQTNPPDEDLAGWLKDAAGKFETGGYKLKELFKEVASRTNCLGGV